MLTGYDKKMKLALNESTNSSPVSGISVTFLITTVPPSTVNLVFLL